MSSRHFVRRVLTRTITVWVFIVIAGAVLVLFIPPQDERFTSVVITGSVGSFAAILAFFVGKVSREGEGKVLAYLYSLFFSVQVLIALTASVGAAQVIGVWAVFYFEQYENLLHIGFLLLVCAYVLGAVVLSKTRQYLKIGFAVVVAGALISPVSLPLLLRPNYLYTLPDITDFRIVDRAKTALRLEGNIDPNPEVVSERISLSRWQGFARIGELNTEQKLARIHELFPYLEGENYIALVCRPLYERIALLSLFCLSLLTAFFFINYLRDPPKPAHFEKIHFALLAYTVFEFLHAATLAKAKTFEGMLSLDRIGKYLTAIVLVFFVGFFLARARFLSMSVGAFYEDRLNGNPSGISRWRDGIDNFLLRQLLRKPSVTNRFIIQRPEDIE